MSTEVSIAIDLVGQGSIKVNGTDVDCKDITIRAGVGRFTEVELTLYANVNVNGVVKDKPYTSRPGTTYEPSWRDVPICAAGVAISSGPCPMCGATTNDVCKMVRT